MAVNSMSSGLTLPFALYLNFLNFKYIKIGFINIPFNIYLFYVFFLCQYFQNDSTYESSLALTHSFPEPLHPLCIEVNEEWWNMRPLNMPL